MPLAGDEPVQALALANRRLEASGMPGSVVLVADAVDPMLSGEIEALREAGAADIHVYAVAAGPEVVPPAGSPPAPALDENAMQSVARAGGGTLVRITPDDTDLKQLASRIERSIASAPVQEGERWKDAGPWLVLLLLPLALAGFRRGLFFVAPLVLANGLLLAPQAEAGWWEDLWLRKDQQAWQSLRSDDPQTAAALARDPSLAGEAWYRSGEYGNAGEACPDDAFATAACEVQLSEFAPDTTVPPRTPVNPPGVNGTTYHLHYTLIAGSSQLYNNHIPVDPELDEAIAVSKTSALLNVTRSQLVPYTITVTNSLGVDLTDMDIVDTFPAGFKYVDGSARIDGLASEPVAAKLLADPEASVGIGVRITARSQAWSARISALRPGSVPTPPEPSTRSVSM